MFEYGWRILQPRKSCHRTNEQEPWWLRQTTTQGEVDQAAEVRDVGFEGEQGQVEINPPSCAETVKSVQQT